MAEAVQVEDLHPESSASALLQFLFSFFLYLAFYCLLLKQTLTNSSCALESSALDYPAVAQVLWKPHKKNKNK